jgi:hypothetical protein
MLIGVVVMHISHEEIHRDFLLYQQAENHTIQIVKIDFEEVKIFTIHPHTSDETLRSQQHSVFIVPVFNYEVKAFTPQKIRDTFKNNPKTKTRYSSCFVSALEQILASLIRKPPKGRVGRFFMVKAHALRGLFIIYLCALKQKTPFSGVFCFSLF